MGRSQKKHVLWTWLFDDGKPAYVGWGEGVVTHPAKSVWACRNKYDSTLNRWLQILGREPQRDNATTMLRYHGVDARLLCQQKREKFRREGENLLDARPLATYAGGGGSRRVLSPELQIYRSVRRAAIQIGVHPSTITRWCKEDGCEWCYIHQKDENEI